MLERNILIVDDNAKVKTIHIPAYLSEINSLKNSSEKWQQYNFNLIHIASMKDALAYLSVTSNCVDVLVVDYDFNGERTFASGTGFVKHIREKINRYCQVVFYTMQGIDSIDRQELVDLVNSDVYKFVDKSSDYSEMARVIFDAATLRNQIVESLEQFFIKYSAMLSAYKYSLGGEFVTFDEIVDHIRMDDEQGRVFIDKLIQKSILLNTNVEA